MHTTHTESRMDDDTGKRPRLQLQRGGQWGTPRWRMWDSPADRVMRDALLRLAPRPLGQWGRNVAAYRTDPWGRLPERWREMVRQGVPVSQLRRVMAEVVQQVIDDEIAEADAERGGRGRAA